eukprot:scaffold7572_cov248-Pinguiococcus_pyrenoidosus.AAC.5
MKLRKLELPVHPLRVAKAVRELVGVPLLDAFEVVVGDPRSQLLLAEELVPRAHRARGNGVEEAVPSLFERLPTHA